MSPPLSRWNEICSAPFALLDFEGQVRLYRCGGEIVEARTAAEVVPALERLRGKDCAGFLSYEAGHALERKLAGLTSTADVPLAWFIVADGEEAPALPDADGAWAGAPAPLVARDDYIRGVRALRERIIDGDIYQANFTFESEVRTAGHPLALFAQISQRAKGGWSAVIFTGTDWILSFSPELFFTCEAGRVTCRPMKGTAPPASDPAALEADPKQRAENLMIVDLLRNDLSRVARPGSVNVPELFAVERYPTVLQMTSTVTGQLSAGLGAVDLLKTIFPCGSVTGAPKIRAMEIIAEQEERPRGVYTGSIGCLSANGDATFNVAIRTLVLRGEESETRIGLGSGIVADSEAAAEWEECLAKGAFVATRSAFSLIETMRIDSDGRLPDIEAHLARLERSAADFDFPFQRAAVLPNLERFALEHGAGRLRLELQLDGRWQIEVAEQPPSPDVADVVVARRTVDASDFRLFHKTSDRRIYDEPRELSGAFEVVFADRDGFLTEGSFTNVFVERDGRLITPPAHRGLLPGILRQRLLESGEAIEGDLRRSDLDGTFYVGNAVRGLIPARLRD